MWRIRSFLATTVLLGMALLAGVLLALDNPAEARPPGKKGFSRHVAGAYLDFGQLETVHGIPLDPPPPLFQELSIFTADGTTVASTSLDFSGGGLLAHLGVKYSGPWYGTWKTTGPRQLTVRYLNQAFSETGEHVINGEVTAVLDFDDQTLQTGIAVFVYKAYLSDQNPLDPTAVPLLTAEGFFEPVRIFVE